MSAPASTPPQVEVTALQRMAGNQSVASLLQRDADGQTAAVPESFLIDDSAEPATPSQMRRSTFLAELRVSATQTARGAVGDSIEQALVDHSIEEWMQSLSALDHRALERRIRDEVPLSRMATGARGYVAPVCARIRSEIEKRAAQADAGSGGIASAAASVVGGVASAASSIASGVAGAASSLASMLFKRRDGAGTAGGAEGSARAQLGTGTPLDAGTRARMEGALGDDFSDVRVHADGRAAAVAEGHGALGFTLGTDVGFGAGQYRPGSVTGDALIAHELAHVVQQRGAVARTGESSVGALEEEADASAFDAMLQLHGESDRLARRSRPSLRSGLQFMSCAPAKGPAPTDPHGRYDYYLEDGSSRLASTHFGTPLSSDFEHDVYDKEFWDWEGDERYSRVLQVRPGKKPSDAIRALFDHPGRWQVDCDHLIQLSHFWARLNTFGDAAFDTQAPKVQLRPRSSTGVKTRAHYGRNGPAEPWRLVEDLRPGEVHIRLKPDLVGRDTDQLVSEAPIGSRVRWTNLKAGTDNAFRHENSLKLGSDKFAAGGFTKSFLDGGGNAFTRAELEERMAKMTTDSPNRGYIDANVFIDEVEHFDRP